MKTPIDDVKFGEIGLWSIAYETVDKWEGGAIQKVTVIDPKNGQRWEWYIRMVLTTYSQQIVSEFGVRKVD